MKPDAPDRTPPGRHPRGLYTLFFTEMWERFSYYGMRALLVLFMVDSVQSGGLGMSDQTATAIYGLYTAAVYLAALPGGWVADRLMGAQRAVWLGGITIAAGHFSLAIPSIQFFYLGLVLIVLGTGLLKPNISAIVGQLYPEGGGRRDAGFTIFYMGINLGAAIGPLICSALGEHVNWHYGFGAAGVGMVLGLVQLKLTGRHLGDAGKYPAVTGTRSRDSILFFGALGVIGLITLLGLLGVVQFNPVAMARGTTTVIVALAAVYFFCLFTFFGLSSVEKRRMVVIVILFVSAALFWAGFEQAGSSLNLFADRYTVRDWGRFLVPTGYFQVLNPFFIITLAPPIAATWVALARRNLDPSLPAKFALGLILLGMGFLVMVFAARLALDTERVWPTWLILTYLLHSVGELCLSPVGLSSVTKLSPPRLVGQMMGIWFLAGSLGNLIAGLFAGEVTGEMAAQMPTRFLQVALVACGAGGFLLLFTRPIKKLMAGVN
jgi:proton-dependent oligopeptide transporter, POT family